MGDRTQVAPTVFPAFLEEPSVQARISPARLQRPRDRIRRLAPGLGLAMTVLGASTVGISGSAVEPGLFDHAERLARTMDWSAVACSPPGPWPAPAYFGLDERSTDRVAETAVVLPVPPQRARAWIESLEEVPSWALLSEEGSPALREVHVDDRTGLGSIRVGEEVWEGRVTAERRGGAFGTRLEMLDVRHVKRAAVEVGALPAHACPQLSVVTARLIWRLGLLARLFGGEFEILPPLFALRIRDDLVARALSEDGLLEEAARITIERDATQLRRITSVANAVSGDSIHPHRRPAPGDLLLRARPAGASVAREKAAVFDAGLRKAASTGETDPETVLHRLYETLQGRHEVAGILLSVRRDRMAETVTASLAPGQIRYSIVLEIQEEGARLNISLAGDPAGRSGG